MTEVFDRLMRKLNDQHLEAAFELQTILTANDKSYSALLNESIAAIVHYVQILRGDKRKRKEFLRCSFWPQPKYADNIDKLTTHVAMFMLRAKDSRHRRYDSALEYKKLACRYLERGTDPSEVAACIAAEGGAHNIIRSLRPSNNSPPNQGDHIEVGKESEDDEDSSPENDSDDDELDFADASSAATGSAGRDGTGNLAPPTTGASPRTAAQEDRHAENEYRAKLIKEIKNIEASGRYALIVDVDIETLITVNDAESSQRITLDLRTEKRSDWIHHLGRLRRPIGD